MTKKKKKIKLGNIYIFINIVFILGCFIFYGYRLIHFYRLEHPKIEENTPLYELITLDKNITTINEGLYKEDNVYRYIGNNLDNYVIYSGRLWRIVSAEDNKVKLITEDPQTSLVWSINTNYENSYVRSWLNDEDNELKSFYESLSNTSYMVNTKTCIDVVAEDSLKCEQVIEDKVGLLSAYEYRKAGGEESYLNIGEYWWTSNTDKDNVAWYVYSKGSLNNTSYSGTTYYSYGVRPTITLNGDIEVIRGNGTKETPYLLDKTTENILNKKYVGEYLNYSGYTWRIIETDDEYVKIAMNGIVKNDEGEDLITYFGKSNYYSVSQDVGKYLNTTFYNKLTNQDYILERDFNTGRYDKTYKYDFNKIAEYKEKAKVGLLQLGELFITDVPKYFLATRTITSDNSIYEVLEEGRIYAGELTDELGLRVTMYLKPDIAILSGEGTNESPYVIE